jgi:hypothetical protein
MLLHVVFFAADAAKAPVVVFVLAFLAPLARLLKKLCHQNIRGVKIPRTKE